MNLRNNLRCQLSIWWFSLILASLALLLLLSATGLLIEDLQHLLFLPLLLAFWRLPRNPAYRIPGPLILTVLVLWLGASLRVHGVFHNPSSRTAVYLSRFQGDKDGLLGRSTFQRYNEIAQTYHLPSMELLLKTLFNEEQTRLWLSGNPNVPLVVGGDSEHFDITFNNIMETQAECFAAALAQDSLSASQRELAKELDIDLERDVRSVKVPGVSRPLLLTMQPSSIEIPDEPSELSRHFMAWLAAGFAKKPYGALENNESNADRLSRWQDAFNEALKIDGPWGTPIPAGLSYYMLGTLQTLEALAQAQPHPVLLDSAESVLKKAAGKAHAFVDPWLYSAVFNNAAVTRISRTYAEKNSMAKAKQWLKMSLWAADKYPPAPLPSRVAVFNLYSLNESGF